MKKLNWQTQPPLEPTVVRIDPVNGKFHIGARVQYKWNFIFEGTIELMWNEEWALVLWDNFGSHAHWIQIERLEALC
jgi:hypothetical protein